MTAYMPYRIHSMRNPLHLVCGDSNESADASVHAAGFQQDVRAIGVVHGECQAVPKGVVYMRLHHMARCPVTSH